MWQKKPQLRNQVDLTSHHSYVTLGESLASSGPWSAIDELVPNGWVFTPIN